MTPREKLLTTAIKITTSDRNTTYGEPENNFQNIANLWTAYLNPTRNVTITAADVAIMSLLIKVARLSTNQGHYDSALDMAGYAACLADIQESMKKEQAQTAKIDTSTCVN